MSVSFWPEDLTVPDHLFANWSSMHANQASNQLKEELRRWLQNPGGGPVTKAAQEDLSRLTNANDLSAVSIDPEKKLPQVQTSSTVSTKAGQSGKSSGLLALFGCASKRK